eukprot:CAMPEP_0170492540 /NCGR_PEP_ID=MMETSP0208-20121228/12402_1 /TAXON_ID=197538 /ORGANISM="Strombidium inclinatum, Strain S3" /LENGTH=75 /DNA_ID=CAMNT_0010768295 /DNA_START=298 /DNA_END=525 /DNA_ORIENTATION=+
MTEKFCETHTDRMKHFYCSYHKTIFCRECIKQFHSKEECFVVDLYEIQRMRQLQKQNIKKNQDQARKRTKPTEKA